jgi:hypothetical protein
MGRSVQVQRDVWPILYQRCATVVTFGESILPMNKRQLIDDIRRFNVTAQPQFLAQFDDAALKQYLEHLQTASRKHVRIGGWVRKQPKLRMVS